MRTRLVLPIGALALAACGDEAAPDTRGAAGSANPCATADADGDGVDGAACGGLDCDDADPGIAPGATDPYGDDIDQDCDGRDGVDADGDGATVEEGDCADDDDSVGPHAADRVGDGVDQDCDGVDGVDADHDGWASEESGGDDCDDEDPDVNPDVVEQSWVAASPFATRSGVVSTRLVVDEAGTRVVLAAVDDGGCRVVDVGAGTTRLSDVCAFAAAPDGSGGAWVAGPQEGGPLVLAAAGGSAVEVDAAPASPATPVMSAGGLLAWRTGSGEVAAIPVEEVGASGAWTTPAAAGAEALALDRTGAWLAVRVGAEVRAMEPGGDTATTLASDALPGPLAVVAGPIVAYACAGGVCVADGVGPWTVAAGPVGDHLAFARTAAGALLLAWSDGADVQLRVRPVGSSTTWLDVPVAAGAAVDLTVADGEVLLAWAEGGAVHLGAMDAPNGVDEDCDGASW
jgi:hypothetical protein